MAGAAGLDELHAHAAGAEVGGDPVTRFGIDLRLSARKPAALHDGDGWIDFGPAGGSYYYSRTDMAATGTVTLGAETLAVEGDAWFDHQWGDFISVGGGGWDWFAVNLDDGTDLTLSLVRAADGTYPLVYGTLVAPDGSTRHLDGDAFTVEATGAWTSPATGARYPAGWRIRAPGRAARDRAPPDASPSRSSTRGRRPASSTGRGRSSCRPPATASPLGGEAYVELTGYLGGAPALPAPAR